MRLGEPFREPFVLDNSVDRVSNACTGQLNSRGKEYNTLSPLFKQKLQFQKERKTRKKEEIK